MLFVVIWHGSRGDLHKKETFGKILSHKLLRKISPKSKHITKMVYILAKSLPYCLAYWIIMYEIHLQISHHLLLQM